MNIQTAAAKTLEKIECRSGHWPEVEYLTEHHVVGMLVNIREGLVVGEKAHRWLGWAQCATVAAGIGTLEDMKLINKEA